ncbi:hypothetical protein Taro_055262 [Colocasia esculenta]|uniref:Ras-related protein Rab-21 n=1 Tax=Colocasia esculenta TaxID=4460 RepID=A0A843XST1_COLES|nr:hypothetical protein [Colocasia esculenta]
MTSRSPNLTFKLVLLGDGRVGKTSLVLRFVNNVFSDKQEATVQAAYLTKRLVVEGVPITLAVWDTAGQERFHALGPIYYRDADAALLVYDITDNDTFARVRNWVKELQQMASKDIIMAIAANKSDLIRSKKFELQEAESYAASIGSRHFVTSAKFGTGIDEIFLHIATRMLSIFPKPLKLLQDVKSPPVVLYLRPQAVNQRLLQLKKENDELSVTPARKGMLIVDDEPEKEPQPKCCT